MSYPSTVTGLHHVQQPTGSRSCGVAVAAMITGLPFSHVRGRLHDLRTPSRRARTGAHDYVNVSELAGLLAAGGLSLGRRAHGWPSCGLAVLRVPNGRVTGWHWMAWCDGLVHDPERPAPVRVDPRMQVDPWMPYPVAHYEVRG